MKSRFSSVSRVGGGHVIVTLSLSLSLSLGGLVSWRGITLHGWWETDVRAAGPSRDVGARGCGTRANYCNDDRGCRGGHTITLSIHSHGGWMKLIGWGGTLAIKQEGLLHLHPSSTSTVTSRSSSQIKTFTNLIAP